LPEQGKPKPVYTVTETDLSRRHLKALLGSIQQPYCLIGGWSVFLIVNDAFQREKGRPYLYSKDIDLGFHFDPNWDKKQFDQSPFGKAIAKIREMGFESQGVHLVKRFSASDGHELTVEEDRRLPSYEKSILFIDLLVDSNNPKSSEMANFDVADELLLTRLFARGEYCMTKLDGLDVQVPSPHLQMEMKIKSFPDRTADDKMTKDLTDLIALILYSGKKPPTDQEGRDAGTRPAYRRKLELIRKEEWEDVSKALDLPVSQAKRFASLIR